MHDWSMGKRVAYGALQAAGLGFLGASLELVALAATLKLPLGLAGFAVLGVAHLAIMGAFSALVAGGFGLAVHSAGQRRTADALAIQLGLTTSALCGWFLVQGALVLVGDDRMPEALVMALMPLGFGVVIYFNARYWLRRTEMGIDVPVGWLPATALMSLSIVGIAGVVHSARDTGGRVALEGDPNLLIISVDGLRVDAIGAYGGPKTPGIDRPAKHGTLYLNAISPAPATTPAVATLFTGLHPLRTRVIRDHATLDRGYTTLAEILANEGYAVGGFVSSATLSGQTGLNQGFHVWEDDLAPLPGLDHLNIPGMLIRASGPRADRGGEKTLAAYAGWLDSHDAYPFFAFVHLPGPAPIENYDEAVQRIDQQVAQALDELDERGLSDRTMVVVTANYGAMRGEHGVGKGHRTLYEPVIHIPMLIHKPGVVPVRPQIEKQVRLMDVMPTALEWHHLDPREETEGLDLAGMDDDKLPSLSTSLVGQAPNGEALIGVRNNGLKYVRHIDAGTEVLFALGVDPGEQNDLSTTQPETLSQAIGLVASESAALSSLLKSMP